MQESIQLASLHQSEKTCRMSAAIHYATLDSPLGQITLAASHRGLCGLYFQHQKHWPKDSDTWHRDDGPRFDQARAWLAAYLSGKKLPQQPQIDFTTGTHFQQKVWHALRDIPPGQTCTYGELAARLGSPTAARAIGAAVGRNPLSILIPCHRVMGSKGALTGYAGGLERKQWLLKHEGTLP